MVVQSQIHDMIGAHANDTSTVIVIRSLPPYTIQKRFAIM
jgi:hypothetical protein